MLTPDLVPLGPGDAGELLTLQRAAYVSEALLYDDPRLPPLTQTLAGLQGELATVIALGATAGGRLVGAVRGRVQDDVLHVGRLVVAPDWQRRGVGSQLLAAIEATRPAGVSSAALFTGHLSVGNLRLYLRHGYSEHRREQLREGLVLVHLTKPLSRLEHPAAPVHAQVDDQLRALEESLWRAETRFDRDHVERVLAESFTEVGRSGRTWSREQVLDAPAVEFHAQLPLPGYAVSLLSPGAALATYRTVVAEQGGPPQHAHRSSIWVVEDGRWRLLHHQGTPAADPSETS